MIKKLNKKSQSQIITTVLLILLVLAAIVIVWQVVQRTVKSGGKTIDTQSDCFALNIDIVKVETLGSVVGGVTIRPNKKIDGFKIYLDGSLFTLPPTETISIKEFESYKYNGIINIGQKVEVAGKSNGVWCPITSSTIA